MAERTVTLRIELSEEDKRYVDLIWPEKPKGAEPLKADESGLMPPVPEPDHSDYFDSRLADGDETYAVAETIAGLVEAQCELGRRATFETEYYVHSPPSFLTVQRTSAPRVCHVCGDWHHKLIVQCIEVRERRKGHGRRIMNELLQALAPRRMGVLLQSTVTQEGEAFAKGLGMKPHSCGSDWDHCAFSQYDEEDDEKTA